MNNNKALRGTWLLNTVQKIVFSTTTLEIELIDNFLVNAGLIMAGVTAVLALIKYFRKFL